MTDHHMPHGHHHATPADAEEARMRREASSQAEPHVDDRAPEAEEARDLVRTLEARIAELEVQLGAAKDQSLRALADFQNYQRRANAEEPRLRAAGVGSVVRHVIPVLDNFDMALAHDPSTMTAAAAVDGLRMVRGELLRALEKAGVELLQPKGGDAFDPHQHEAIMHAPAAGVAPGHVSSTLQCGYRLGETVLRPAKVAVAP
jgi:molecular chaperone GrpE